MSSREHTPSQSTDHPGCPCGHHLAMHDAAGCGHRDERDLGCPCRRYLGAPRIDRIREVRRTVALSGYDAAALEATAERALEDVLRRSRLTEAIRDAETWQMGYQGGEA